MLTPAAREAKQLRLKELEAQGCLLVNRVEKYLVNFKDPNFTVCDKLSNSARALYNSVNYYCRNQWEEGHFPPSYLELEKMCRHPSEDKKYWREHFKSLPVQTAQQVLIALKLGELFPRQKRISGKSF